MGNFELKTVDCCFNCKHSSKCYEIDSCWCNFHKVEVEAITVCNSFREGYYNNNYK